MFIITVIEYDYFKGQSEKRFETDDRDEAMKIYERNKKYDFDYGDHYRITRMNETEGRV